MDRIEFNSEDVNAVIKSVNECYEQLRNATTTANNTADEFAATNNGQVVALLKGLVTNNSGVFDKLSSNLDKLNNDLQMKVRQNNSMLSDMNQEISRRFL